jgi:outer membrane protein TolC
MLVAPAPAPLSAKLAILFAGLLSVSQATPLEYAETSLPELQRILEQAKDQAPELVLQTLAQGESRERLSAAKAAYYPRFDLNSNIGTRQISYESSIAEDERNSGANFYAVIRRPLYHWGAIEARIKQARIDNLNEDLQRVLILRQLRRSIRADYLTLLVNKVSLENLEQQRANLERQFNSLASSEQAGTIASLDAQQGKLNLDQSVIDIDYLKSEQQRIYAAYKRTIGWDESLELAQPVPAPNPDEIIAWVEKVRSSGLGSLDSHAELLRRKNLVDRERAELVSIKSNQRPLVNIAASALRDQRNVNAETNINALTFFVGLDITWNIFDGFQTSAKTRESNLRKRRYEAQLESYRAELTAQAYSILNQISFQARQLHLNEKRARVASDSIGVLGREAAEGRISAQTLSDRVANFNETNLGVLRSRVILLLSLNDFIDLTLPASIDLPAN